MNEVKKLTASEAWEDFWSTIKPTMRKVPNELHVAQSTWKGVLRQKSGKVKSLGGQRVKRLLEKYAPGVYEFHESVGFTKET